MSMPAESLNAMLVARDVHTGVYLSKQRRGCVVVKVKEGKVWLLRLDERCTIVLETSFVEKFLVDFPIELYHYPAVRMMRKFHDWVVRDHLPITDEARKIVNAVLVR